VTRTAKHLGILVLALLMLLASCTDDAGEIDTTTSRPPRPTSSTAAPETTATTTTQPPSTTTTTTTTTMTTTTTTTTVPGPETCSAPNATLTPGQTDLVPEATAATRAAIIAAALACDFDGLEALAAAGFDYTLFETDPPDPAAYWREREGQGFGPMSRLLEILTFPAAPVEVGNTTVFVWPSVAAYPNWASAPQADRDVLAALFTPEDMERFARDDYYLGSTVGIDAEGNWVWYIPGEGN
jgi:hypothetical protein